MSKLTCKLYGRLGNQAWQIASTIGLARANGIAKYFFPNQTIAPHVWPYYFTHLYSDDIPDTRDYNIIKESTHAYHKPSFHFKFNSKMEGWILDGYWQSAKYFNKYINEVRDVLRMPSNKMEGVVSVHYRAGDYRNFLDKHPIVSDEYILNGIEYFISMGYKEFMLFSDEPFVLMEIVSKGISAEGIKFTLAPNDPLQAFYMMSTCEHGVVCNSTFSVMAHILNRNPNKVIIRPHFFFGKGNGHLDEKDIYPKNWIAL